MIHIWYDCLIRREREREITSQWFPEQVVISIRYNAEQSSTELCSTVQYNYGGVRWGCAGSVCEIRCMRVLTFNEEIRAFERGWSSPVRSGEKVLPSKRRKEGGKREEEGRRESQTQS